MTLSPSVTMASSRHTALQTPHTHLQLISTVSLSGKTSDNLRALPQGIVQITLILAAGLGESVLSSAAPADHFTHLLGYG